MTAFLTANFSDAEIDPIKEGIRKFIRLIGLFAHPLQGKWIAEEQDLIAALETVKSAFAMSHRMLGKRKYQGLDFDAPNEVKKDMQVYLLTGITEATDATMRKTNQPMYYLVIEPVVDLFYKVGDHAKMLEVCDELVDEVIELVKACKDYGDEFDAAIVQEQVRAMHRAREEVRKEAAAKKKPRKSKRDLLIELLAGAETDPLSDEETAELFEAA